MMLFPINLNLVGKLVVVVGGGPVGRRKARVALNASAQVKVIDPLSLALDSDIEHVQLSYHADQLSSASLVFACATRDVNAQVVADCRLRGIWVNSASDSESGDFVLPAVLRQGELAIAVSTGSASPTLASNIRDKLAGEFDDAFAQWIALLAEFRLVVLDSVTEPETRRELLRDLADWKWLEILRAQGFEKTRMLMNSTLRIST